MENYTLTDYQKLVQSIFRSMNLVGQKINKNTPYDLKDYVLANKLLTNQQYEKNNQIWNNTKFKSDWRLFKLMFHGVHLDVNKYAKQLYNVNSKILITKIDYYKNSYPYNYQVTIDNKQYGINTQQLIKIITDKLKHNQINFKYVNNDFILTVVEPIKLFNLTDNKQDNKIFNCRYSVNLKKKNINDKWQVSNTKIDLLNVLMLFHENYSIVK